MTAVQRSVSLASCALVVLVVAVIFDRSWQPLLAHRQAAALEAAVAALRQRIDRSAPAPRQSQRRVKPVLFDAAGWTQDRFTPSGRGLSHEPDRPTDVRSPRFPDQAAPRNLEGHHQH